MVCKECGKINEDGKFCEACGAKLETGEEQESVATAQQTPTTSQTTTNNTTQESAETNNNEYVDKAKDISKTYFSYFLRILKSPLSESQNIRREEFINGVITIVLYALFIPLMIYLSLGSEARNWMFESPFLDILLKPTIGYAVFIFLIAAFVFIAVQLGNVKVSIKDVIARFGALLVPFVAFFVVGFVLALLQTGAFAIPLSIGVMGSTLAAPALVIQSFKENVKGGLDAVYGVILAYILTLITFGIMSAILIESMMRSFDGMFNLF